MIKKLSLKGFADFMLASPIRQISILRGYKYPSSNDARAKILYYREARNRIAEYHKSNHDISWFEAETKPKTALIKIISQCMYEAANAGGLMLPASSILLFDIPRGETYSLAKEGEKSYTEIKATCKTISTLWETI
ncbi:MAG: hypothetical protein ABSE54_02155 [Smithella sp.]|jgi:hypothetical protein